MEIKKYFHSPLEVIKNLEKLHDSVFDTVRIFCPSATITGFSLEIDSRDRSIKFENYKELLHNKKHIDLKKIDGISLHLSLKEKSSAYSDLLRLFIFSSTLYGGFS